MCPAEQERQRNMPKPFQTSYNVSCRHTGTVHQVENLHNSAIQPFILLANKDITQNVCRQEQLGILQAEV